MDWMSLARGTALSVPERLSIDLERLILDGTLAAGERLPSERELSTMLGVSRVSVRQGLYELESRGLIDRRPGRGTIVLSPGERAVRGLPSFGLASAPRGEVEEIMELRALIEPPIARLAAERATPRDLIQLEELVRAMENESSKHKYAELDRAFHQAIAQYTHNPLMSLINEQISDQIAPIRAKRFQTKARRASSSESHRKIYEAIASRNGDLAETEAREHISSVLEAIAKAATTTKDAQA